MALFRALAPCTHSHNSFSLPQPRRGCSPSLPCCHTSPKASGPAPSCSGDSVLCWPSSGGGLGTTPAGHVQPPQAV